jgi:hypothetical protein
MQITQNYRLCLICIIRIASGSTSCCCMAHIATQNLSSMFNVFCAFGLTVLVEAMGVGYFISDFDNSWNPSPTPQSSICISDCRKDVFVAARRIDILILLSRKTKSKSTIIQAVPPKQIILSSLSLWLAKLPILVPLVSNSNCCTTQRNACERKHNLSSKVFYALGALHFSLSPSFPHSLSLFLSVPRHLSLSLSPPPPLPLGLVPCIFFLARALVLETLLGRPRLGYFRVRLAHPVHPKAWAIIAHPTPSSHPTGEGGLLTTRPQGPIFNPFAVVFFRPKSGPTQKVINVAVFVFLQKSSKIVALHGVGSLVTLAIFVLLAMCIKSFSLAQAFPVKLPWQQN